MLEEQKMDKKYLNRSSQPQSKAQALDTKRNTELTHKPWPRSNKKREGTGNALKNEPYRKCLPTQRGRGQLDRRPRSRSGGNNSMGGTENTGLDDDEPELGSVFSPGSKKQNLNHLLNFMYPTRGGPERREYRPRRLLNHVPHKHEHDLYLRAYCQFVMKEGGDYKANMLDPDVALKWEQIEEIVVRSSSRSECPICLGSPVAARVGVCGHVYCWACVLHYVNTHDKQPPPCPVCTTPLHVKDMKPARMLQWKSCTEEVTMRLVRRLRGSTVVEMAPSRGQLTESEATPILPLEKLQSSPYCKLFSASKQQIRDILHRERKEIKDQILEEVDTSEIVYLEQALEMLKSKEEQIDGRLDPKLKIIEDVPECHGPVVYEKLEVNDKKIDWFDVSEEGAAAVDCLQNQLENLNIDSDMQSQLNPEAPDFNMNNNEPEEFPLMECFPIEVEQTVGNLNEIDKKNQAKYFYFYQADDGEQVFLNSLNLRILNASWGALPAAPQIIRGRVLQRETLSLSEQIRKHMPHTAHLPLYCSFDIVELDLQPPYVTVEAIISFSAELDRRARTRARNEREERRRERAYRRAMEGPPRPDFTSDLIFPPTPTCPVHIETVPVSPETQPNPSSAASPSGMSFAKMASTSGTWRVRKTAAPSPPPIVEDQEATGPRTLNLSDAIEAALHAPAPPSNGKKKKTKHKVLFATGMQRAD